MLARLHRITDGLFRITGRSRLAVVIRQIGERLLTWGGQPLQCFCDAAMHTEAARAGNFAVQGFTNQRVCEHVVAWRSGYFVDDVRRERFVDRVEQLVLRDISHSL